MSDEVKQAADRLRAGRYSSLDDLDEYYMSSRKFEDMGILADAYLDEHANDEHDDETAKENATVPSAEAVQAAVANAQFILDGDGVLPAYRQLLIDMIAGLNGGEG